MSQDGDLLSRRSFLTTTTSVTASIIAASTIAKTARAASGESSGHHSIDLSDPEHCLTPIKRIEEHNVVIVGTGFGGAVSALRFGQAGIETLVLERGREWPITTEHNTFSSFTKPDARCRWLGNTPPFPMAPLGIFKKTTGVLERIKGPDIDTVVGAGVGGSSLAFGGVMAQPPRDLFEKVFPREISYDEMENTYYPRVKAEMAFSKMPDDIYNSKNYKVARMFEEHAKVSGYEATRLESVYNWSIVRQELRGELPQSTTVGQYMYGVSSGAKLSVDKNYIKRAKETGNVEVRPLHAVQKIGQYDNGKYFVEVAHLDIHGNIIERIRINCHHLVLSAGSMWTSKLLMKAKYSGSLPNLNDHVGKFWGNNGERVFLRMALPESTLKTQGGPPSVGSMFQKTPYGPASYEIATTAMPFELHAMCIAALGIPDGHGGFTYNPRNGKVLVRYPKSAHQGTVKRLAAGLKDWNRKTGGWLWDFDALSGAVTYHPLGGAVLGKACDYYGRVHGYPGLYVIDGALIPGSTACANPAWTVAAISERCLDHIIQNDFGK